MAGAHWVRAALQVNPYSYRGRNSPSTNFDSEKHYNAALLEKCDELSIGIIAITDHWAVDTASGLIKEAAARGIVALPGFEANTAEGAHLLVIFDVGTTAAEVNAAIGACDAVPGCGNGSTGASFDKILERMSDLGALVIPAHANVPNSGLLTGRQGNPLVKMINHPLLHALGISPGQAPAQEQEAILRRRKPFDRKHPIAVVHADDISHPDGLETEGGSTWFKVSGATVESLKIALRTPETRVALTDPKEMPRPLLKEISWVGGFLDGVTLPISSDLTALIGGRGTGKSTAIESLRYVLELAPIGALAKSDHDAIIQGVLRAGTKVKLRVVGAPPMAQTYVIERSVNNPAVVKDASGTVTSFHPRDVVGDVEIFGQHELAELTGDSGKVASMLKRFQGTTGLSETHKLTLKRLEDNREKLSRAESDKGELEEELADIPRLAEQVRQFEATDVPTRLSEVTRMKQDEAVFAEGRMRVAGAKTSLSGLNETQLTAKLGASYEGLEESPQRDKLQVVKSATTALAEAVKSLGTQLATAITVAEAAIDSAELEWKTAVRGQREENDEVLRSLVKDGLEPEKYLTTVQAHEDLKAKEPRLASSETNIGELLSERKELLQELAEHENKQLEELHDAIRTANAATGGVVVVRPIAAQDRRQIKELIERSIRGQRTQIMAAIDSDGFSTRSLVDAARKGEEELAVTFGIRGAQAKGLVDAGESLFRQLEEMSVGNGVEVQLDVGAGTGTREFKKMVNLSKGQRATALLLLLLGASQTPLVIDQPEDDLDNKFVYDGIVRNLRELKGKRQIIAATHNANVPVLGDAELIIALEGNGQNGMPVEGGIGSIDDARIRTITESILEGGPAAFSARQHLYGF